MAARDAVGRGGRLTAIVLGALVLAPISSASAAPGLATGFADGRYTSSDPEVRQDSLDRTASANAAIILVFANWRGITAGEPATPADPADPEYEFSRIDAAVRDASARGLEVILSSSFAPDFAEGPNRPADAAPGTWRPDPAAFGAFAQALARRYSGTFAAPEGGVLPRVRFFQAWSEPNLWTHLSPQYGPGPTAEAPALYRGLLNAFYDGIKSVHSDNQVITAGAAPYGDPPGEVRTRPRAFWRDVLCLTSGRHPSATACPVEARFDIFAHNAITTSGGPTTSAIHPDDVATPDFERLAKLVRAAETEDTIDGESHPLWATELWWETDPPDFIQGYGLATQARWIQQGMYILWKQGARVVINLQLQDTLFDPSFPAGETATGIFFSDGSRKPSHTAFAFPFVTEAVSKRKLDVWGKAPATGKLTIKRRTKSGWRREKSIHVVEGAVFRTKLRLSGEQRLRAEVAGRRSLVWHQRRDPTHS